MIINFIYVLAYFCFFFTTLGVGLNKERKGKKGKEGRDGEAVLLPLPLPLPPPHRPPLPPLSPLGFTPPPFQKKNQGNYALQIPSGR